MFATEHVHLCDECLMQHAADKLSKMGRLQQGLKTKSKTQGWEIMMHYFKYSNNI